MQREPRGRRRVRQGLAAGLVLAVALIVCLPESIEQRLGAALAEQLDPHAPPAPEHLSPVPLGSPQPAPYGSGGFSFLATRADGSPVTWDPCRPIHYVARPGGAPDGGAELLRWALGRVTAATGLRFVADGTTTEAPGVDRPPYQPKRYGRRWAPVLVAWSTPAESPDLAPDKLGVAGPTTYGDGEERRHVSGTVVLNAPAIRQQLESGRKRWARAVLLHELGHLVGLGHVDDPYTVMYGLNAAPLDRYRAGDLRGLEILGRGACFADH